MVSSMATTLIWGGSNRPTMLQVQIFLFFLFGNCCGKAKLSAELCHVFQGFSVDRLDDRHVAILQLDMAFESQRVLSQDLLEHPLRRRTGQLLHLARLFARWSWSTKTILITCTEHRGSSLMWFHPDIAALASLRGCIHFACHTCMFGASRRLAACMWYLSSSRTMGRHPCEQTSTCSNQRWACLQQTVALPHIHLAATNVGVHTDPQTLQYVAPPHARQPDFNVFWKSLGKERTKNKKVSRENGCNSGLKCAYLMCSHGSGTGACRKSWLGQKCPMQIKGFAQEGAMLHIRTLPQRILWHGRTWFRLLWRKPQAALQAWTRRGISQRAKVSIMPMCEEGLEVSIHLWLLDVALLHLL